MKQKAGQSRHACCFICVLMVAALIAWLHVLDVLVTGCETWEHQKCGFFFKCARCVHFLQNIYWVARARFDSQAGVGMLILFLIAGTVALFTSIGSQRAEDMPESFKHTSIRVWVARTFFLTLPM